MRYLSIYLNDHLAGSTVGVELARRIVKNNAGTEFEPPMLRLVGDIEEDRRALERLMEKLGVARQAWKTAGAFVLEKVTRLKLNGQLLGYSPLSRVVELESLQLGVEGKRAMWRALQALAEKDQRIDREEMVRLERRAVRQRSKLEDLRIAAARMALSESSR